MRLIGPFSQILTLADLPIKGPIANSDLQIIENGGVLLKNGKIHSVGKFEVLRNTSTADLEEIEKEMVLIPGMVDCHTHLLWGGSRAADFERRNSGMTYQEILNQGGGILDTVEKTRNASDDLLTIDLNARLDRHLKRGITTVEVKTGYGLSAEHEIRFLRLINEVLRGHVADVIPTFLGAHVCPKDFGKSDYLDHLVNEVFPVLLEEELTDRVDIFVEEEAFDYCLADRYLAQAKKSGFRLTAHAGQFSPEGVHSAVNQGALSADHLETIGSDEIEKLANSETVAVALPGASLGLGMDFTPARQLLDGGASLAIATDWNPGSAPNGDLLTQASILATYEKLTNAEILAGITFRAAGALGLYDRGRIEEGKIADFVGFPTSDYREIVYHQGQLQPKKVWKKGELL